MMTEMVAHLVGRDVEQPHADLHTRKQAMATTDDKPISLRALQVFDQIARTGSMRDSAHALNMSSPAASQQLRNLELTLGQPLIDHTHRPLTLTQAGLTYLVHVRAALQQLQQGAAALSLMDLTSLTQLRMGIIDDLDSQVVPRLAVGLAAVLTRCDLSLQTAPSHLILASIADRTLDVGIAAQPPTLPDGIRETPVLRDPFVLAVPRGYLRGSPDSFAEMEALPFLRYEKNQLIGRQIAAQLRRLKLAPDGRIELDSNQALFGLVANGAGWAITTPLGYLRAQRFQAHVDIHPLPTAGFTRTISLFQPDLWREDVSGVIASSLRGILQTQVVDPAIVSIPWLKTGLMVLNE